MMFAMMLEDWLTLVQCDNYQCKYCPYKPSCDIELEISDKYLTVNQKLQLNTILFLR